MEEKLDQNRENVILEREHLNSSLGPWDHSDIYDNEMSNNHHFAMTYNGFQLFEFV